MVLDTMPLNENGKVDRRSLPELVEEVPAVSVLKPASKLEKKLVELWEELLQVKPIGTDQNFFAIGGHSLVAARLMYRIEKATGKRLPIATLLEAPTIEKLADMLQQEGFEPRWSSLVPIQTRGAKPPLFCVHGVGGNALGFRMLGRYFDSERPLYGLQARGLNGIEPCHTRVEDMAADYLSEIRTVQPHGPYHIGGFSFGGLVAFEMAQQLLVQGEAVGLLALLDTYADKSKALLPLGRLLISPAKGEFLKASAVGLVRTLRWKRRWLSLPENIKRVHDSCSAAANRYRLRPYGGRITLICTRQTLVRAPEYKFASWRQVAAGGVEVRLIEGNHGDMLGEPQVASLAETLKSCLDSSSLVENAVMVPYTGAVPTYVSSRPNVA
jgi:thioesterase domain-containing protein/acyl carrier protein